MDPRIGWRGLFRVFSLGLGKTTPASCPPACGLELALDKGYLRAAGTVSCFPGTPKAMARAVAALVLALAVLAQAQVRSPIASLQHGVQCCKGAGISYKRQQWGGPAPSAFTQPLHKFAARSSLLLIL